MITISSRDMSALAAHAESKKPNESCAVLLGRDGRVTEVALADNADESGTSFAIPDEQLVSIYESARESGTEVVGIFHSHPASGTRPSHIDEKYMRINPVVWVIYSGLDGSFGAYELRTGIVEVPIVHA